MFSIGIDVGATNTKFVLLKGFHPVKSPVKSFAKSKRKSEILFNRGAKQFNRVNLIKKEKISTPKNKKKLIKVLKENIKNLISKIPQSEIKGIGIGVPGPLNKKRDFILNPPNLKYLSHYSLAKIIERELNLKTMMENDVNCFALAEAVLGSGKGAEIVAGITLGTGVGGGIVIKNPKTQISWTERSSGLPGGLHHKQNTNSKFQIFRGAFGSAGEFGFMTINFDGENSGFLEDYCSEKFFKRKKVFSKTLEEKAKKGDKKALNLFQEYGKNLGIGISNIINILDPEVIVIGGGISKANRFFMKAVKKEIQKRVLSPLSKKSVKIKMTQLKDFAGAIGAALLVENK